MSRTSESTVARPALTAASVWTAGVLTNIQTFRHLASYAPAFPEMRPFDTALCSENGTRWWNRLGDFIGLIRNRTLPGHLYTRSEMPRPLSWPRTILAAADPAHSASVCSRFIDLSHEIGPARGRIVMASSADEFAVLLERLPFENASHVLRFGGYTIGIGILVSAYFYLNNHSNGNAKPIDLQIVCFSMLSSSLTIALAYVAKITSPTRLLPAGASILSAMIVASGIDYLLRSSTLSSQKS